MDPEVRKELETIRLLVKDNHTMLKAIRRDHWFGLLFKLVFWTAIIVIPFLFYRNYLEPLLSQFSPTALGPQGLISLPSGVELEKLIQSYKLGQ